MAKSKEKRERHRPTKPQPAPLRSIPPADPAQEELDAARRSYETYFADVMRQTKETLAAGTQRRNEILPGLAQLVSARSVAQLLAVTGDDWKELAANALAEQYYLDRRDADFTWGDARDDVVSPHDQARNAMSHEERQRLEIEAQEQLDLAIVIPLVKGQSGAKPEKWMQSDPRTTLVIANASRAERGETLIIDDDPDRLTAQSVDQIISELQHLHTTRWRKRGQSLAGQVLKRADEALVAVGARRAADLVGEATYRKLVRRGNPDRQPTRPSLKPTRAQLEKVAETLRERLKDTEKAYALVERLYVATPAFARADPAARIFFLTELKARSRPLVRARFLDAPPRTRDELIAAARGLEEKPE